MNTTAVGSLPSPVIESLADVSCDSPREAALESDALVIGVGVQANGDNLVREAVLHGRAVRSRIPLALAGITAEEAQTDPLGAWWKACMRGAVPRHEHSLGEAGVGGSGPDIRPVRVVDLFAGAGGFLVGVGQLLAEAGLKMTCELAVDIDLDALRVHARNHGTKRTHSGSATSLVDYRVRGAGSDAEFVYSPELLEDQMHQACSSVDLVVAGPPCQGHSNLNNHSRRSDPRNRLYLAVPAFAVASGAGAVVVENVPSVIHDDSQVVQTARKLLESSGYRVTDGVLSADAMGWPQTRKRHFLVARREVTGDPTSLETIGDVLGQPRARTVGWAIGGGQGLAHDSALHEATEMTETNRQRIQWLFENDEHDLALDERPECHQEGTSYGAVYGRMHVDRPAPTITTGFTTPGRGRFVHPSKPRTLTPAEAARLQGFPDTYRWRPEPEADVSRSQLAKWIGDAVAMPLGYAAALSALAPRLGQVGPKSAVADDAYA